MEEVYEDCTSEFWTVLRPIAAEQLVMSDGFSLQRLMHALEVMDPNMDAGMPYPPNMIDERDRVQIPFTIPEKISDDELCFVMDRLFALELEWIKGAALGQTLYTCRYYHEYMYTGLSNSLHYTYDTLTSFVLATAKCCALQYHELMHQRVLDGEDFNGDPGGIALPDGIDVPSVVANLNKAMERLFGDDSIHSRKLYDRLAAKKHWLKCIAAVCRSVPDIIDAEFHLVACNRHWNQLDPNTSKDSALGDSYLVDGPASVQSFFDVTMSRIFSTQIPLRPLAPKSALEVWSEWKSVIEVEMPILFRVACTPDVLPRLALLSGVALSFQQHAMTPFVRSLAQSIIHTGYTSTGEKQQLEFVAVSAIEDLTQISVEDCLTKLEWSQHKDVGRPMTIRLQRFIQRLSGLLIQLMSTLLMNRPRQKRTFAKAYAPWNDLLDEAVQLGNEVSKAIDPMTFKTETFSSVVQYFIVYLQVQIIGSGFDLELYSNRERAVQYYLLSEVFREQEVILAKLLNLSGQTRVDNRALERLRILAQIHSVLCSTYALIYLCLYDIPKPASREEISAGAAFARRLKWLRRPAWCEQASFRITQTAPKQEVIPELWTEWNELARSFLSLDHEKQNNSIQSHVDACSQHLRDLLASEDACASNLGSSGVNLDIEKRLASTCVHLTKLRQMPRSQWTLTSHPHQHPWYPS
ncbi:N-alpha-acetyltransferase, non-catalitic subunit [Malassezia psittaci]|uniref:N-alpha-acetyltransferase, non-catalitic subunit n=1 Tax=Malassezia psittaci TaxID=1821823 RepID=A0AAF0JDN4_9BASI|nr:N-alpha-acetyltransferase, non-catalitic subunit [Malassezia psittaci]